MKTVIIYATQHGTTETVAKHIQNQMRPETIELINLATNKQPDLSPYDVIILGSSIHAGKNQPVMQAFCKRNIPGLLQKNVGLYLCCLNKKEFEQNILQAYPEILRNHAFDMQLMGGEYKMDKMNFIERFLVRKITGINRSQSAIDYDSINRLTDKMRKQMKEY